MNKGKIATIIRGENINTDIIKNYIKENDFTIQNFAKKCSVSESTMYSLLKGNNVKRIVIFKIAIVMKVEPIELIRSQL